VQSAQACYSINIMPPRKLNPNTSGQPAAIPESPATHGDKAALEIPPLQLAKNAMEGSGPVKPELPSSRLDRDNLDPVLEVIRRNKRQSGQS
jgi:hypothetical protein